MRRSETSRGNCGFTMVEMLVVIAIIGILAALLLPALSGGKARAKRIVCETQLQQIGIAFHGYAHDHNSKFPWQVSVAEGGSEDFIQGANLTNGDSAYLHFQPLVGLMTPNILVCPADTRLPAATFATLLSTNVSYFAGVTADYNQPMSVLAGDGNLIPPATVLISPTGGRLTWNRDVHQYKGNVLFADGHVEEWGDNGSLRLGSTTTLVMPTTNNNPYNPYNPNNPNNPNSPNSQSTQSGGGMSSGLSQTPQGGDPSVSGLAVRNGQATTPNESAAPNVVLPRPPPLQPSMHIPSMTDSSSRQHLAASQVTDTNSLAEGAASQTNAPALKNSVTNDESAIMSSSDRKAAAIMRDSFVTGYLLVLLILLLIAAYRIRRWMQNRALKRRRKVTRGYPAEERE